MASSSRGARKLASSANIYHDVCFSCRRTLIRRRYASTSTATATVDTSPTSQFTAVGPRLSPVSQPRYTVKAGIVLSRAPIVTPDMHPFEKAYYLYMRRLNERLVLPFTQYFYYKRGTPSYARWRVKRDERGGVAARDVGNYNAYQKESWNDEALVGSQEGEPEEIVKRLIDEEDRATESTDEKRGPNMGGLTRRTMADERNDQRSLDRALSRTLYLLVKNRKAKDHVHEEQQWSFPNAPLEGGEALKEGAQRILTSTCGPNMNTWFVGSHPVGHLIRYNDFLGKTVSKKTLESSPGSSDTAKAPSEEDETTAPEGAPPPTISSGEKTFFMKARIFAGQADLKANKIGIEDYKWLAKDEVQRQVTPSYWSRVKNMLVDQ